MDKSSGGEAVTLQQESEKPSRWWMLYHFWAGMCAKFYVDVSGLSKFILGSPGGSDPAFVLSYAGSATTIALGAIALGYFLSKSLINVIDRSAMPRKGRIVLKSLLPVGYFLAAVLLPAVTAPLLADSEHIKGASAAVAQQSDIKPVMVFTTTQSAEGVTEADLDQSALKNLEMQIVESMLQNFRNEIAEMGYNPKDFNFKPKVSANSVYINVDGKKLAVIKVNMNGSIRLVTIMGINGAELLRVNCIRASDHDILVLSGECGKEVQKTFGVSIQP